MKGVGFKFDSRHSYNDFGLVLDSKQIADPQKSKIKISVPYMNGTYDFSTIGSGGEQVFGERDVQVILGMPTGSKEELQIVYSQILEWLKDTGRQQLIFDDMYTYYFEAEVETVSKFEEMYRMGKITIMFTAQPFRHSIDYMGDDIWDDFCFLTDYTQYSNVFDITEDGPGNTVIMYNNGRPVVPEIDVDVDGMRLNFKSKTYYLIKGSNKFYDLKLENGENIFHFYNAIGKVKIIFRCEVL